MKKAFVFGMIKAISKIVDCLIQAIILKYVLAHWFSMDEPFWGCFWILLVISKVADHTAFNEKD